MRRLEGKRILVTGATGGLGGAIVARPAARGATIVATGRNADPLAALQKAPATPTRLTTIAADLLSESSIEELAAAAAAGGTVDGLVNCAGMYRSPRSTTSRPPNGTRFWGSTCGRRSCSPGRWFR